MGTYRYRYIRWSDPLIPGHLSNKSICPQCHKRTFVRVIDTDTGELLPDYVGKCDRENSCGYYYPYAYYLREKKALSPIHYEHKLYRNRTIANPEMKEKTYYIDKGIMEATLHHDSDFYQFMVSIFGHSKVEKMFDLYNVGADEKRNVIFWQIDNEGNVRSGKVMKYDSITGHRSHEQWAVSWYHSKLKKEGILPPEWQLSQTLFGSHLTRNNELPICVVEAEKTALISAIMIPDCIWLATGGMQNFSARSCAPLKGRDVILYPDLGAYKKWEEKAITVSKQVGFNYELSNLLEKTATDQDKELGLDIADFILRENDVR